MGGFLILVALNMERVLKDLLWFGQEKANERMVPLISLLGTLSPVLRNRYFLYPHDARWVDNGVQGDVITALRSPASITEWAIGVWKALEMVPDALQSLQMLATMGDEGICLMLDFLEGMGLVPCTSPGQACTHQGCGNPALMPTSNGALCAAHYKVWVRGGFESEAEKTVDLPDVTLELPSEPTGWDIARRAAEELVRASDYGPIVQVKGLDRATVLVSVLERSGKSSSVTLPHERWVEFLASVIRSIS